MSTGRVALGITKVITCIVGFGFAGMLIWSLSSYPDHELYLLWGLGGVLIGLCVGICWASGRVEMRIAFIMPLLVGLLAFWVVLSSYEDSPPRWSPADIPLLLILALAIAGVWALSRFGAFAPKQDEAAPHEASGVSGVDVIEQIRELGELKNDGILSDEEFESKKHELLGRL